MAGGGHTEYAAFVALALAAGIEQCFVVYFVIGGLAGGITGTRPVFFAGGK